jgi:hypothetical protein
MLLHPTFSADYIILDLVPVTQFIHLKYTEQVGNIIA